MTSKNPPIRRRRLGNELRRLREEKHKKLEEVAEYLGCSVSTVSRIENGQIRASVSDVRDLLEHYGVPKADREGYIANAKQARQPGWWRLYDDVIATTEGFRDYVELEDQSSSLRVFENALVPGLLQTEAYARAVFEFQSRASEREIARRIQLRMTRQKILDRSESPSYLAVLDEAVLRRTVRNPEIMCAQLRHLLNRALLPRITIQIVPFSRSAYLGQDGPLTVLTLSGPPNSELIHIEGQAGSIYLEEPEAIARKIEDFTLIHQTALSPRDSQDFIRSVIEDLT